MTYREYIEKYVKENNIKKYLSNDMEISKEFENKIDYDMCEFNPIATYNYILAMKNEDIKKLLYLISVCEFEIEINKDGKLDLIDMQGAYLGGIDSYENFETLEDICERLEGSFFRDYWGIDLYEYNYYEYNYEEVE